jgi:hypothetical protein
MVMAGDRESVSLKMIKAAVRTGESRRNREIFQAHSSSYVTGSRIKDVSG